jgi:hypothetical protein
LVTHRSDAEAQFVYNAWLDAGGKKTLVEDAIREWLVTHRSDAEAQFVYNAWLDAGGKKTLVEDAIRDWLVTHRSDAEARFVYNAWLDAGGKKTLVEDAIREWLVTHRVDAEASHVYKAWLDADGDRMLVRDAIAAWLILHGDDVDADHVFKAWLESEGERELVWDAAIAWLAKHRSEQSAVYVTKFIAKWPELPENTIRDILTWCRAFPEDIDALWRLTQLGNNLLVPGIVAELVSTAEIVLSNRLARTRLHPVTRGQITYVLAALITSSETSPDPIRQRVNSLFVRWLRHPLGFGADLKPVAWVQRPLFLRRVLSFVSAGVLDARSDHDPLNRFAQWLNMWDKERKQEIVPIVVELKNNYPIDGLWEIVDLSNL